MTADTIIIQGLEIFAHHGVLPEEKRDGQYFYLDIELAADLSSASVSDNLNDTINYDEVCRIAGEVMTDNTYDLIEKAAGEVCSALLEAFPAVEQITLTLRKPSAPVCQKIEYAAVRLVRKRIQPRFHVKSGI